MRLTLWVKWVNGLRGSDPSAYERAFQLPCGKSEVAEKIIAFIRDAGEKSAAEITAHLGMSSRSFLLKTYLKPLVSSGHLALSLPDKPRSQNQKYVLSGADSGQTPVHLIQQ